MSPQELSAIKTKAAESGLNISEYIRRTAMGSTIKKRQNLESDKILFHLAKIGANLNQLALQANLGNYNSEDVDLASLNLSLFIKQIK